MCRLSGRSGFQPGRLPSPAELFQGLNPGTGVPQGVGWWLPGEMERCGQRSRAFSYKMKGLWEPNAQHDDCSKED